MPKLADGQTPLTLDRTEIEMPVVMDLVEDGHILRLTITDPWTVNDVISLFPTDQNYRDRARYRIHTLVNVLEAKTAPPLLLIARYSPSLLHPRHGHCVVAGAVPMIRSAAEIAFRMVGFTAGRFFDTEEAAWAYLRQIIATEN